MKGFIQMVLYFREQFILFTCLVISIKVFTTFPENQTLLSVLNVLLTAGIAFGLILAPMLFSLHQSIFGASDE